MGQVASHMFGSAAVDDDIGFVHDNLGGVRIVGVKSCAFGLVVSFGGGAGTGHIGMVNLVFNRVGSVVGWGFDRNVGSFLWLRWNKLVGLHFVDDAAAVDGGGGFAVSEAMALDIASEADHFLVVGVFRWQSTSFGHCRLWSRFGGLRVGSIVGVRSGRDLARATLGIVEGKLLFALELALQFGKINRCWHLTLHDPLSLIELDIDLDLGVVNGLDSAQVMIDSVVLGDRDTCGLNVGKCRVETLIEELEVLVVFEVQTAEVGKCPVLAVGVLWCAERAQKLVCRDAILALVLTHVSFEHSCSLVAHFRQEEIVECSIGFGGPWSAEFVIVFENFSKLRGGTAKLAQLSCKEKEGALSLFKFWMELERFEILVRSVFVELKDDLGCAAFLTFLLALLLLLLLARFLATIVVVA
jgi:hypothetical protein